MKQPDLGKKISELRLAKGLTQSELAEKCNLSLRTIQRIESAEVTPRSYSVKLIFKNLDYEGYTSLDKDSEEDENVTDRSNLKTNITKKALIIALVTCIIALGYLAFDSKSEVQSAAQVKTIIKESQANIKKWMNTNQVDSVLTLYKEDACVLQSICGKIEIRKMLQSAINKNYKLLEYNIVSVSVADSIAVEKYENIHEFKGKTRKQVGITEWRLTKGKWFIVNDVFREY
ncbi:helix-turn-helix transcriptional regulator [Kordia sp. YSTF-M3]|uniref:Helix-turn-helix transcriptional regulator n=1 Tax=Kordia aestuariivivens TaxID=2759037 RepID=A0ABR7QB17_9FLAO|nr:helix-turn-helix domain-containing protein [Kordia aestuariivivens]MBC8755772.1 helix-turn-helix transcriptional regulator [Kordia aestuariivivens]